jgi:hypothetical protein
MAIKKRPKLHLPAKAGGGRSSLPGGVYPGAAVVPPPLAIDAGGGALPPDGTIVGPAIPAVPDQSSGLVLQTAAVLPRSFENPGGESLVPFAPAEGTSPSAIVQAGATARGVVIMKWIVPVVVGIVVFFLTRGIGWALLAAVIAYFAAAWWAKKKASAAASTASA